MDRKSVLEELVSAARSLGIRIRNERLGTGSHLSGGLVRLRGAWVIMVDSRGSIPDQLGTLSRALARFDTSSLELSEDASRILAVLRSPDAEPARARASTGRDKAAPKNPFLRPKPGLRRTAPSGSTAAGSMSAHTRLDASLNPTPDPTTTSPHLGHDEE